jgi:hypothetical protein
MTIEEIKTLISDLEIVLDYHQDIKHLYNSIILLNNYPNFVIIKTIRFGIISNYKDSIKPIIVDIEFRIQDLKQKEEHTIMYTCLLNKNIQHKASLIINKLIKTILDIASTSKIQNTVTTILYK